MKSRLLLTNAYRYFIKTKFTCSVDSEAVTHSATFWIETQRDDADAVRAMLRQVTYVQVHWEYAVFFLKCMANANDEYVPNSTYKGKGREGS